MKAIVLGAGAGTRMGGPKALLPWEGTVLSLAHARALHDAGAEAVFLVAREPVVRALEALGGPRAEGGLVLVTSWEPDEHGMAGSLRAWVKARGVERGERYLITPVDALPVRRETALALVEAHDAWGREGALPRATRPVYGGRGGHPVLVDGVVLEAFAGEGPPPTLREVLRAMGDRVRALEVGDPTVRADLDTPEDVVRWTSK